MRHDDLAIAGYEQWIRRKIANLEDLCPGIMDLSQCYQDLAAIEDQAAAAADAHNVDQLLASGFPMDRIHWVEGAGVYSIEEFRPSATTYSTYAPSYVNGLILGDTYLMPTYPGLEEPDFVSLRWTDHDAVAAQAEKMMPKDLAARDLFTKMFRRVIPIRSDMLFGGAIHCSSYSYPE